MKNVFVILTAPISSNQFSTTREEARKTVRVAINMSRVQEMWPQPDGSTRLLMNIPKSYVMVMESIEVILQKLDEANSPLMVVGGVKGSGVPGDGE
jgi:hypothetical protein